MTRILFFSAPWCESCPGTKRAVQQAIQGLNLPPMMLELIDMETDEGRSLAGQYGFRGLPTVIGIGDNGPEWMYSGASPERDTQFYTEHIRHWLEV